MRQRFLAWLISGLCVALLVAAAWAVPGRAVLIPETPTGQNATEPLERRTNPALYVPHGTWMGRLILPARDAMGTDDDWCWIELVQAPPDHAELLGRRLRLEWAQRPELTALVKAVSTKIQFSEEAWRAANAGHGVPERLNGRLAVGPLESLAGARPDDDVIVRLDGATLAADRLVISRPPVQITGRWTALVQLLREVDAEGWTTVRHYNPATGGFQGPVERLRIPRHAAKRDGRQRFNPTGLSRTPLNRQGWYIHGDWDRDGWFTVEAIEPRALGRIGIDQPLASGRDALRHLATENWGRAGLQPGATSSVLLQPTRERVHWSIGDRALVLHSFGGIGGRRGEPTPAWTVTGHFAFGQAEVVQDPISGEPRLAITYHQIYANNPDGIVAGSQDWSAYSGDLQRGWLGLRPISDAVVHVDGPLLNELAIETELISARYRSGDGSGVALVTPSTSCVQDSSQALWIALNRLTLQQADADLQPRQSNLIAALERQLTPFAIVRADWRQNASISRRALMGTAAQGEVDGAGFRSRRSVRDALLSWRSMLPRRAHDDLTRVFLQSGHPVRLQRTNGDWRHAGQPRERQPDLWPLAPTTLFGQIPAVGLLVERIGDALLPAPFRWCLGFGMAVLTLYAAAALPLGWRSGLLRGTVHWPGLGRLFSQALLLLLSPALIEELIFRVMLLPNPLNGPSPSAVLGWAGLSLGAFVLYHPLAGRLWYPAGRHLFDDPRFLSQATLLGLACTIAYLGTGSLWPPLLIHWLAVVVWLELLDGRRALAESPPMEG